MRSSSQATCAARISPRRRPSWIHNTLRFWRSWPLPPKATATKRKPAGIGRGRFAARRGGDTLFLVPPDNEKSLPDKPSQRQAKFMKLRRFYALRLFQLARKALDAHRPEVAYALVHQVLREDPHHEAARKLLDYQEVDNHWRTPFAARKHQQKWVDHPRFGWLPKDHVGRYEAGHRRLGGRWVDAAEEDRVRGRRIEGGWQIETEHYKITTNHSLEAGVELGRRLEELHSVWRQLFAGYWFTEAELRRRFEGKPGTRSQRKHRVVLFRNKNDYVAHLKADEPNIAMSLGYYVERQRTAYFYAGDKHTLATWFHEATHQLFHERRRSDKRAGLKDNFWIVEGIALYMESLQKRDGYYTAGGMTSYRLQFARYRALTEGYFVPLSKLVPLGRADVQKRGKELPRLYSQSAGLAHFLMDGEGGQHRGALMNYLQAVYRDQTDAETLSKLARRSYEDLDRAYRRFLSVTDEDLAGLQTGDVARRLYLGRTRLTDKAMGPIAKLSGVERLDVGYTPVTDAGLQKLPTEWPLVQLNLEQTKMTDASLPHISRMQHLQELDLSGCRISDSALAHVAKLENLQILWLTNTSITDAGLRQLHGLKKLQFVDLDGTRVTSSGWQALKRAVPGVSQQQ